MKFEDTNEYRYLSALIKLLDELLDMADAGEFTKSQKDQLFPYMKEAHEVLDRQN